MVIESISGMPARKWCFIPYCNNSSLRTPLKIFVTVPRAPKKRKKWFAAARRNVNGGSPKSSLYCCEDHFDLEKDMENYMEYKLSKVRARMNPDIVPHKFACQPDRSVISKRRELSEKRARRRDILEYLQQVEKTEPLQQAEVTNICSRRDSQTLPNSKKEIEIKTEYMNINTEKFFSDDSQTDSIKNEIEIKPDREDVDNEDFRIKFIENLPHIKTEEIELEHATDEGNRTKEIEEKIEGDCKLSLVSSNEHKGEDVSVPSISEDTSEPEKLELGNCDVRCMAENTDAVMGKCQKCEFYTKLHLPCHFLSHKDPSEVQMYQCDQCRFETRNEEQLKCHQIKHKDPSKTQMYRVVRFGQF